MVRSVLLTTALLISSPAIAQTAASPADTATEAQPGAATPAATGVASIVDSEFPAYDADSSGQLEQAEFSKWMVALKEQELKSSGKSLPPAEVTAWVSGAFTSADADKSSTVTKAELVTYLSGGAA